MQKEDLENSNLICGLLEAAVERISVGAVETVETVATETCATAGLLNGAEVAREEFDGMADERCRLGNATSAVRSVSRSPRSALSGLDMMIPPKPTGL